MFEHAGQYAIFCPNCQHRVWVDKGTTDETVTCANCKEVIEVETATDWREPSEGDDHEFV